MRFLETDLTALIDNRKLNAKVNTNVEVEAEDDGALEAALWWVNREAEEQAALAVALWWVNRASREMVLDFISQFDSYTDKATVDHINTAKGV